MTACALGRLEIDATSMRLVNISLAFLALVGLSPALAVIAAILRLTCGSPVLFRQRRTGLRGTTFFLLKFRTMNSRADAEGRLLPDGERLTQFGQWLRRFSLDEIPQLWNVFRGDMNLVGPRPLLPQYTPRYSSEQRRRLEVKPGITGWAQVNGRNELSWEEKFRLDVWYVDHRSFWLDCRILLLTLLKVIRCHGISKGGHATMPEFMGSARAVE
jgi:sugar transferase EpsL